MTTAEAPSPTAVTMPSALPPMPDGERLPRLTLPLSLAEFEALLRRIIREEICALTLGTDLEENRCDHSRMVDDDPALIQSALEAIEAYENAPDAAMDWEEFEVELARAEAAGELPD